jgi:hypothetical protein
MVCAMTGWIAVAHGSSSRVVQEPSLAFSTYFGGKGESRGIAVAVDRQGFVYIAGRTRTSSFPTRNAAQARYGGGENDAFLAKLSPDGQQLVYSTLLGGSAVDMGESIAVDGEGNAFLAGTTYSSDFPTTKGALQRSYGGGDRDGFVAKFDPGGKLVYSTFIGGNRTDRCTAVAVDGEGNAYLTGSTNSRAIARVPLSSDREDWDVLFAAIDPTGSKLLHASRFGGTAGVAPPRGGIGGEQARGIEVVADGSVYIAGSTDSADFPVPGGAQTMHGGRIDGFVVRLAPRGQRILAGTFLGGGAADNISGVALGPGGVVTVAGTTQAIDFPTESVFERRATMNDFPVRRALQPEWKAFLRSAFVTRFTGELSEVLYSTYFGGTNLDTASDVDVDARGHTYIVGTSQSRDLPLVNPLQQSVGGSDIFVAAIAADGASVLFSTYLGTRAFDEGSGIAVDGSGGMYVIGYSGYGGGRPGDGYAAFPVVRALQPERGAPTFQAVLVKIKPGAAGLQTGGWDQILRLSYAQ